jgi:hypothetical protein
MPVVEPTNATDGMVDAQFTVVVTLAVVPSEYVPTAISCVKYWTTRLGALGVIEIDCKAAGITFRVALPDTEPDDVDDVAVMTVEPRAMDVAAPEAAPTVANAGLLEFQVIVPVRSAVLPSLNVPVAFSCCVSPIGTLELLGVTAMDTRVVGTGVVGKFSPPPPPQAGNVTVAMSRRAVARKLPIRSSLKRLETMSARLFVRRSIRSIVIPYQTGQTGGREFPRSGNSADGAPPGWPVEYINAFTP